ncbi:MAG: LamG-like jellyroll fold domain-containing protein, partial [Halobacteriales archaeon]|nr:LamG-like jellyroll fold domain-containing protein [Halobacteriales archaeon]
KYRIDGDTGAIQQLVEHRNDSANFEWFVETEGSGSFYNMHYTLWPDGNQTSGVFTNQLDAGDTHVVVGTYDGERLRFYRDGQFVGSKAVEDEVEMGALYIGADAVDASSQHLDGRIYQLRLYYDAMDDDEVAVLSDVMAAEAE